ncbi:hypothetical protein FRB99_004864 [Tulasnella sp. 403]|nr:hypothetical protein FRB99_004864 [Tulasnella sp. 403]
MMTVYLGMLRRGSPLASNLTRLKLLWGGHIDDQMGWDRSLHLNVLVGTLQACPTLVSLELEYIKIIGTPSSTPPPLYLPRLRSLALDDMSTDAAHVLLPLIDAPSCDILRLAVRSSFDEAPERVHDVLDTLIVRTVCANINKPSNVFDTVWARVASEREDQIAISVVPTDLSSEFYINFEGVGGKLLHIIGHSPASHLAFMRRFPLVDTLTVDVTLASEEGWEAFLGILTTHQCPDDGDLLWPALQSLTVVTSFDEEWSMTFRPEPFLDFHQARIRMLHGKDTGTTLRMFKKLHFKGICGGIDEIEWAEFVEVFEIQEEEEEVCPGES